MANAAKRGLRCSNCAEQHPDCKYLKTCGHVICPKCALPAESIPTVPNGDAISISSDLSDCPTCQKVLLLPDSNVTKLAVKFNRFDIVERIHKANQLAPAEETFIVANTNGPLKQLKHSSSAPVFGSDDEKNAKKKSRQNKNMFVVDESKMFCPEHPTAETKTYCKVCQVVFCEKKPCLTPHSQHDTTDLHDLLHGTEGNIQRYLQKLAKMREKLHERDSLLKQKVDRKRVNYDSAKHQVQAVTRHLHEALNIAEHKLLHKIDDEKAKFESSYKKIESHYGEVDSTIAAIYKVKDIILGNKIKVKGQGIIDMEQFLKCNDVIIEDLSMASTDKEMEKMFQKGIDFIGNTDLLHSGPEILGNIVSSSKHGVFTIGSIQCRSADDKHDPRITAIVSMPGDEIACVDMANCKIKMFSVNGPKDIANNQYALKWENQGFQDGRELASPADIALLPDGDFLVVTELMPVPWQVSKNGDVQIFNEIATMKQRPNIKWTCVCNSEGDLFFGGWDLDKKQGVILKVDHDTRKRTNELHFKEFCTTGFRCPSKLHVLIDAYSRRIITMVVAFDCWGQNFSGAEKVPRPSLAVMKRDNTLRYMQEYGEVTDVCIAWDGQVLAPDKKGRVLLLNDRGIFQKYLVNCEDGLGHPLALTVDKNGRIIVSERSGDLKVFKLFDINMVM